MSESSLFSIAVAVILLAQCDEHACKRHWDYEPLAITTYTSDETKVNINATLDRVGRGVYAVSAYIYVNIVSDETLMLEAVAYRSFTGGEDDYILMPWTIPKQTFKNYVESYYDNLVYSNLRSCSDVPKPEDAYPWPKGVIKFDKCTSLCDGFPEILPQGYYKIYFNTSGQIEAGFRLIVKVTTKTDLIG